MVKKITTIDELQPNVYDGLKRAYVFKRGVIARPKTAGQKTEPSQSASASTAKQKTDQSDETYPEKVAEGEPDERIESEEKDKPESLDKLKSETEGSKTAKGPKELAELTEKSLDILYEATTVFPFTLFPDTLTLDREKLTIANRHFWRAATITSVPVGEIMSAEVLVGPFFGSLDLTFRFFTNNERKISFLKRHDAIEIQRLIHGYIIAHRREIDVSSVKKDELIELLSTLGQGATD